MTIWALVCWPRSFYLFKHLWTFLLVLGGNRLKWKLSSCMLPKHNNNKALTNKDPQYLTKYMNEKTVVSAKHNHPTWCSICHSNSSDSCYRSSLFLLVQPFECSIKRFVCPVATSCTPHLQNQPRLVKISSWITLFWSLQAFRNMLCPRWKSPPWWHVHSKLNPG